MRIIEKLTRPGKADEKKMEKTLEVKGYINDLYSYLKKTDADRIIVRTTHVKGGWDDNQIDAHCAEFDIYRFQNPEYLAQHKFADCYELVRRK